jgi:hypothetical protein
MSAASSAAVSRPFLFDSAVLDRLSELPKLSGITPASRLEVRATPENVSSGTAAIDTLTGGLPRGCLTEICGPASSGRTSLLMAAIAAATRRGEVCALIDAGDSLDPVSAAALGIDFSRMLWVRCGMANKNQSSSHRHRNRVKKLIGTTMGGHAFRRAEEASPRTGASAPEGTRADYNALDRVLRVTDLLLQSNGFGLIALDLADISERAARRIPLASWFRFRRAIEVTPTVLLVIEQQPIAGSCSSLLLRLQGSDSILQENKPASRQSSAAFPSHARLLETLHITVELSHMRLERKPPRNTHADFSMQTAWSVS